MQVPPATIFVGFDHYSTNAAYCFEGNLSQQMYPSTDIERFFMSIYVTVLRFYGTSKFSRHFLGVISKFKDFL